MSSLFHRFGRDVAADELPHLFTYPFYYEAHPLVREAAADVRKLMSRRMNAEETGKMFGVLVVENGSSEVGYIAAYSGELDGCEMSYFVPPIVDYLAPDGYFKRHEAEITAINTEIKAIENGDDRKNLEKAIAEKKNVWEKRIEEWRKTMKAHKKERDERRMNTLTGDEEARLIRESQFEKAELARMQKAYREDLAGDMARAEEQSERLTSLRTKRKELSEALQAWLFNQYHFRDANGVEKGLDVLFAEAGRREAPSGSGDCCAPRMMQYAYLHGLKPIAMGEFWIGPSPKALVRREDIFYPACLRKCRPILTHMMNGLDVEPNPLTMRKSEGLDIVFEDQWLAVVNKPCGLQSVPGTADSDSVLTRFQQIHPDKRVAVAHRLDQRTSGIIITIKDVSILPHLCRQFEERSVSKRYVALVERRPQRENGRIELPIGRDPEDSVRRCVDYENGKKSDTTYKVIGERQGHTLVELMPHTGRTHQLRLHCSHPDGLNSPIIGDDLYGNKGEKMYLCSVGIQFVHPVSGETVKIDLPEEKWFS